MATKEIGYSLIELGGNTEVAKIAQLPARVEVPGVIRAFVDKPGQVMPDEAAPTHKVVVRHEVLPTSKQDVHGIRTTSFDGVKVIENPNYTAASLDTVRAAALRELNLFAQHVLSKTDHHVLLFAEDSRNEIPPAVITSRAATRAHLVAAETDVQALTTVAEIEAYRANPWPGDN